MNDKQWEYNDMICDMAKVEHLPAFIKHGFDVALSNMKTHGDVYRDIEVKYEDGALQGWW